MHTIRDLLKSPQGKHFLALKGLMLDHEAFIEHLAFPPNPLLGQYLGQENTKPVFSHQQIYLDCTQSMRDRMELLAKLSQFETVSPFFLWIDTDRAGTDKIGTRLYWPHWGKIQSIPICPNSVRDIETRFVTVDQDRLQGAVEKLGIYLVQSVNGSKNRAFANKKFEHFKAVFLENQIGTLSEFNLRLTYFMLKKHTELNPTAILVSKLLSTGVITTQVNMVLNCLDDVIQVFNQSIDNLIQENINPVVKPLAADYLPLNYSCPICDRRIRLKREIHTVDHFAVGQCRCGERYHFFLGNTVLSIDELEATQRWSPDVCLPLFLFDLVSGLVGGVSSGIYCGVVMNAVIEQVFGHARIPVLLPPALEQQPAKKFDSLLYEYLMAPKKSIEIPIGVR